LARIFLEDFITFATGIEHTATSYRVWREIEKINLVDESIMDKFNLREWNTPLPDGNGGYLRDMVGLFAEIKIHFGDVESEWYMINPTGDQFLQQIKVEYLDGQIVILDSRNNIKRFTERVTVRNGVFETTYTPVAIGEYELDGIMKPIYVDNDICRVENTGDVNEYQEVYGPIFRHNIGTFKWPVNFNDLANEDLTDMDDNKYNGSIMITYEYDSVLQN